MDAAWNDDGSGDVPGDEGLESSAKETCGDDDRLRFLDACGYRRAREEGRMSKESRGRLKSGIVVCCWQG